MRFIIDAHLPPRITKIFQNLGYEAIHTSELPKGNAASDEEIIIVAAKDGVVISKDDDFYQRFLLKGEPPKLIHVKVGNMRLKTLIELFEKVAPKLINLLGQHDLLELHADKIIAIA